jgi:hypothetical protein
VPAAPVPPRAYGKTPTRANPWDVRPLQGVGPLAFGMTPAQVQTLLGPPTHEPWLDPRTGYPKYLGYRGFHVGFSRTDGRLADIVILDVEKSGVTYNGRSLDVSVSELDALLADPRAKTPKLERYGRNKTNSPSYYAPNLGLDLERRHPSYKRILSVTAYSSSAPVERSMELWL